MEFFGTRIELVHTNDPYTKLKKGDKGTVKSVYHDGMSNILMVDWDSGSSLSLIEGEDRWNEINEEGK